MLMAPPVLLSVIWDITPADALSGQYLSSCIPSRLVPHFGPITARIQPALRKPVVVSVLSSSMHGLACVRVHVPSRLSSLPHVGMHQQITTLVATDNKTTHGGDDRYGPCHN